MIAFLEPVLAVLRKIPLWIYVLIIALLVILYYKHEVVAWRNKYTLLAAQNAVAQVEAAQAAAKVSDQRIADLNDEVNHAKARADSLATDNASLVDSGKRVSVQLAAIKKRFADTGDSAASDELKATRSAVLVFANLLGERQRTSAERSRYADEAASAAAGCTAQYESIHAGKPAASATQ